MTTNSKEKTQLELNYKCEYNKTRKPPPLTTKSLTWKNTSKHIKAYRSTLLYTHNANVGKNSDRKYLILDYFVVVFVAQPAFEQLSFFPCAFSLSAVVYICVVWGLFFCLLVWLFFFFLIPLITKDIWKQLIKSLNDSNCYYLLLFVFIIYVYMCEVEKEHHFKHEKMHKGI